MKKLPLITYKEVVLALNSPILVNEYSFPFGNVWGNPEDGFQFDLMQIWSVLRKPIKMHPLRWLDQIETQKAIRVFETNLPQDVTPLFPDFFEGELGELLEDFRKDPDFDDSIWWDPNFRQLFVNPALAHIYIRKVFPKYGHTLIYSDPSLTFEYRGFTLNGFNNSFTAQGETVTVPLFDVAPLGGHRIRGAEAPPILKFMRKQRQSSRGLSVQVDDMHRYGSHILRRSYGDGEGVPFMGFHDTLALVGIRAYKIPDSHIEFPLEFLQEVHKEMKCVRDATFMSGRAFFLVTREMAKFLIEACLAEGLLKLNDKFLAD